MEIAILIVNNAERDHKYCISWQDPDNQNMSQIRKEINYFVTSSFLITEHS